MAARLFAGMVWGGLPPATILEIMAAAQAGFSFFLFPFAL
jgi:hypothetical protein